MISTTLLHPSQPKTLGELRQLTTSLPDDTRLALDDHWSEFPPPAIYFDTQENTLTFMEPYEKTP